MASECRENREIMEEISENNFNSKMAMKKAGHTGLLVLTTYLESRLENGEIPLARCLVMLSVFFLLLDDIEWLVHAVKVLVRRKK